MIETIVVCWVLLAIFAVPVARSKGFDGGNWFLLCLVFGVFAAFALVASHPDEFELVRRRIRDGKAKVCPACAEAVRTPAIACPHCNAPQPVPQTSAA